MKDLRQKLAGLGLAFVAMASSAMAELPAGVTAVTFPDAPVDLSSLLSGYFDEFGKVIAVLMGAALIIGLLYKGWRWVKRM
jgi:hypothetical protein